MTIADAHATPARELLPGQDDLFGPMFPPPVKFAAVGDCYTITIDGLGSVQDRDYDHPEKLLFWPDGQPKMVTVIYGPCDNGEPRSWWVRGKQAVNAVRQGAREAGVRGFSKGDQAIVTRGPDVEIPPKNGKGNPVYANGYEVVIIPAHEVR